jgi:repressor of nif and glnA expression
MGASRLAAQLRNFGIDLSDRAVRLMLEEFDGEGLTENLGRRGRRLTPKGAREAAANISATLRGFVSVKADSLASQMTFNLSRRRGSVILNYSLISMVDISRAAAIILRAFEAGLGFGELIAIGMPGDLFTGHQVPEGHVAIGTVCGVSANGIFFQAGIPIVCVFGGLLEIQDHEPRYFQHIIHYDGTTIDPLEIFMKGAMTSVSAIAETGNGALGAGFREIPAVTLHRFVRMQDLMKKAQLRGILAIGKPGQPLAGVPVTRGRVGVIVAAGLNPIAAAQEQGIPFTSFAMSRLYPYEKLVHYSNLEQFV